MPLGKECVQNSDLIGQVFEKKCLHLHQGCLVTDYLVLTPNMNTLCNRGKVGLICFVAPQKSIFLWRPPLGFNFQMSKGVNLSPLVNPENKHKLKKKEYQNNPEPNWIQIEGQQRHPIPQNDQSVILLTGGKGLWNL